MKAATLPGPFESRVEAGVSPVATELAMARGLRLRLGGLQILDGLSFSLRVGEIVLLTGDNGCGKTTLLNILSGFLRPDDGRLTLRLHDRLVDATRSSPHRLAAMGVGRLWQELRLFSSMSVLENVLVGTPRQIGQHALLALVARPYVRRQEHEAHDRALAHLGRFGIEDRAQSSCDRLSFGQMKRVALARILQLEPSLLLLDEPLAGLDQASAKALLVELDRLRREDQKTILVVEHRHEMMKEIANRVFLLRQGHLEEDGG